MNVFSAAIKRPRNILYILIVIAMGMTFYPLACWMVSRFLESGSYYSHGFLIPIVVAALIWRKRKELRALPVTSSPAGFVLAIGGLVTYIVAGVMGNIGFAGGISCLFVVTGTCLYLFGAKITRAVLPPLLFLLLMIPLPQVMLIVVAFKLKMLSAAIAEWCARQLHCSVHRAGSMLYLPGGTLVVESACSGISSLISLFSLSALLAYTMEGGALRKAFIVASSVPVAVLANAARIVFLVLAAYVYGIETAANSVVHYGAGMVLWAVALAMFSAAGRAVKWKW
jgi:exosortase